ncbi:hypothetical protein J6590_031475 [Homalodisca vitripennis]|nr:hypothetical protein J6590_031475 [Homalodisca vitripennis]
MRGKKHEKGECNGKEECVGPREGNAQGKGEEERGERVYWKERKERSRMRGNASEKARERGRGLRRNRRRGETETGRERAKVSMGKARERERARPRGRAEGEGDDKCEGYGGRGKEGLGRGLDRVRVGSRHWSCEVVVVLCYAVRVDCLTLHNCRIPRVPKTVLVLTKLNMPSQKPCQGMANLDPPKLDYHSDIQKDRVYQSSSIRVVTILLPLILSAVVCLVEFLASFPTASYSLILKSTGK